MLFKVLLIILITFVIKLFVIRFDFRDYFNITISFIYILFSYLYIMNKNILFFLIIIILSISLILYSYYKQENNDYSVLFINGSINFKNMLKNNYSLLNLVKDLKNNKISFINSDTCGVLIDNKLVFYSKDNICNKPVSVIVNGNIDYKELYIIGKSKKWIEEKINEKKYKLEDIFYAFYYNERLYIIKK